MVPPDFFTWRSHPSLVACRFHKRCKESVNDALKSMSSFGCIAHPGTHSDQVMLLRRSTPCARLELSWPALCTRAVVNKLLVNHSRTQKHSLSTIVEKECLHVQPKTGQPHWFNISASSCDPLFCRHGWLQTTCGLITHTKQKIKQSSQSCFIVTDLVLYLCSSLGLKTTLGWKRGDRLRVSTEGSELEDQVNSEDGLRTDSNVGFPSYPTVAHWGKNQIAILQTYLDEDTPELTGLHLKSNEYLECCDWLLCSNSSPRYKDI